MYRWKYAIPGLIFGAPCRTCGRYRCNRPHQTTRPPRPPCPNCGTAHPHLTFCPTAVLPPARAGAQPWMLDMYAESIARQRRQLVDQQLQQVEQERSTSLDPRLAPWAAIAAQEGGRLE